MDEELKNYLDAKFSEARAETDRRLDAKIDAAFTRFSQHILHEVGLRFNETNAKLDSIDSRLKLQAGLIQSGARAMARFSEFAESSEQRWVDLVTRLGELERRFDELRGRDAA